MSIFPLVRYPFRLRMFSWIYPFYLRSSNPSNLICCNLISFTFSIWLIAQAVISLICLWSISLYLFDDYHTPIRSCHLSSISFFCYLNLFHLSLAKQEISRSLSDRGSPKLVSDIRSVIRYRISTSFLHMRSMLLLSKLTTETLLFN